MKVSLNESLIQHLFKQLIHSGTKQVGNFMNWISDSPYSFKNTDLFSNETLLCCSEMHNAFNNNNKYVLLLILLLLLCIVGYFIGRA